MVDSDHLACDLNPAGPANISNVTHMPSIKDVVYIDKHPQPSHDQITMPQQIKAHYGQYHTTIYYLRLFSMGQWGSI